MTTDYSTLPTPELNDLIHKLSVESRNRYETTIQLDKIRKLTVTETVDYENQVVNINAKASRSDCEAIPYAE
jgi:hypothetical protein